MSLGLTIVNPEVVSGEFLSSANLTKAQALDVHKPLKVIMVDKHKNFMFAAF